MPNETRPRLRNLQPWHWFILVLMLTAGAYWNGLSGAFLFDDYNNIVDNDSLDFSKDFAASLREAAFGTTAGPLKRPLSMLSFALNKAFTGVDPFAFKLTNLAIHLLNGWLVFILVYRLLSLRAGCTAEAEERAATLACTVAAIWLLHPAQLTSVLYVVQRMTSLSATFVLLGMVLYLAARLRMQAERPATWLLWLGMPTCCALSILAKENGVLLFLFAFVTEWCLLDFRINGQKRDRRLVGFFVVFVGLPCVALLMFLATHPEWLTAPNSVRPFTVLERLMTESRVLFMYVRILFVPSISSLALYFDDFPISRGLLDPPSTVVACVAWPILVSAAIALRRRLPWASFAVLWFATAHLIESTFVMLELVHVHRNYIAFLGPIVALVVTVHHLLRTEAARLRMPAAMLVIVVLAFATAQRAQQWGHPLEQALYEVTHRPLSPRANYEIGRLYFIVAKNRRDEALRQESRRYFQRAMELDRHSINAAVALLIVDGGMHIEQSLPAKRELQRRLSERPLASTEAQLLRSLIRCQEDKNCRRPSEHLLDIFGSTLSQPSLRSDVKADVLALLAMYYANYLGDFAACIRTMNEAVKLVPDDANHRLNLVNAYLVADDLEAAAEMLNSAEQRDRLGIYGTRIATYKKDIADLRAKRNRS